MGDVVSFRPVKRREARAFVAKHHSHHKAHVGEVFAMGAEVRGELVGVVIAARPVAPSLDDSRTWEITRLCVKDGAPHCTASRLLGRVRRVAKAAGVARMVSYTRADEPGTCYRASGWEPAATVRGRPWTSGNKSARWLPGFYEPSTEIVDRVRWEVDL